MDYERTSAPHDSPPPLQPSPFDWLLRLRLRTGSAMWPGVLVGAGVAALVHAAVVSLFALLALDNGRDTWLIGLPSTVVPGAAALAALALSDVTGGLAIGVMERRQARFVACLTGLVLRLPRVFAAFNAPVSRVYIFGQPVGGPVAGSLIVSAGLVVLSLILWVLAAWLGAALAMRRLSGLGLS